MAANNEVQCYTYSSQQYERQAISLVDAEESRARCSQNHFPDQIPITNQPDEKIALMRTTIVARTVRSVRNRSRSGDRLPEEVVREETQDLDVKTSIAGR
jgi:hypothetical protein